MDIQRKHKLKRKSLNIPGHAHELTFSCYKNQPLLKFAIGRSKFIYSINKARVKYEFDIWAWVIMPDHVHILIFPKQAIYSIPGILKAIKQPTAQEIVRFLKENNPTALRNLETGLKSPQYRFWQDGGGYDRNYWEPEEIHTQVNYIHNNPVRRGLCASTVDYRWSSAREWKTGEKGVIPIDRETFPVF